MRWFVHVIRMEDHEIKYYAKCPAGKEIKEDLKWGGFMEFGIIRVFLLLKTEQLWKAIETL